MEWEFERLAGPFEGIVEGPAWDGEALLFTVVQECRVYRFDPATGEVSVFREDTGYTNGLAFSSKGELYACQSGMRRIARFDPDGSTTVPADRLDGHPHNQPNDLAIDARGRIWFSDPLSRHWPSGEDPMLDHASVLRLDPDATITRVTFDTRGPNGILVSADQKTLYVAETPRSEQNELRAYPIQDDGSLGPYQVLHAFGLESSGAHRGVNGMCLDSEGNIVACAGWEDRGQGPMVYVFSPRGRVLETHPTPVDDPTNCTFGGPGLDTLYVTTGNHSSRGGFLYGVANTGRRGWLIYP